MKFAILSIVVLGFLSVSEAYGLTRCHRWQGKHDEQHFAIRCLKDDNTPSERILISHRAPCGNARSGYYQSGRSHRSCIIKYSVGVWTGPCNAPSNFRGERGIFRSQYLRSSESKTYTVGATGSGICTELYVFECTKDNRPYDCWYAVNAQPYV